jgi:hypothetical protein
MLPFLIYICINYSNYFSKSYKYEKRERLFPKDTVESLDLPASAGDGAKDGPKPLEVQVVYIL